jgi:hypothetical protein
MGSRVLLVLGILALGVAGYFAHAGHEAGRLHRALESALGSTVGTGEHGSDQVRDYLVAAGATLAGMALVVAGARGQRAEAFAAEERAHARTDPQLVGAACAACGAKIVVATDARGCRRCGRAVHARCARAHRRAAHPRTPAPPAT